MKVLLDTHLLIWAASAPDKLPAELVTLMQSEQTELFFSAASIWEIAIKRGLCPDDFRVDPRVLRRGLLDNEYNELRIGSEHAVGVESLPPLHRDPFDRLLIAQATVEGITLLTKDSTVGQYPGPIRLVS